MQERVLAAILMGSILGIPGIVLIISGRRVIKTGRVWEVARKHRTFGFEKPEVVTGKAAYWHGMNLLLSGILFLLTGLFFAGMILLPLFL